MRPPRAGTCGTAGARTSSCARPRTRPAPRPAACCRSSTTTTGAAIRQRSLDSTSAGRGPPGRAPRARPTTRATSSATSGPASAGPARAPVPRSSAIPTRSLAKIHELADAGIEAFILSGYPHAAECDLFARYVLPHDRPRPARLHSRPGQPGLGLRRHAPLRFAWLLLASLGNASDHPAVRRPSRTHRAPRRHAPLRFAWLLLASLGNASDHPAVRRPSRTHRAPRRHAPLASGTQ